MESLKQINKNSQDKEKEFDKELKKYYERK